MSDTFITRLSAQYEEAVACMKCIRTAVGSSADVTKMDFPLLSTFYDQLSACLLRIKSEETRPYLLDSLQSLLNQCQQHQARLEKILNKHSVSKNSICATPADGAGDSTQNKDSDLYIAVEPSLRLDDVAGLEEAKQSLTEALILPLRLPQLFTGGRRPWSRVLLYGPPGTGKSRLAEALAGEAGARLVPVTADRLLSAYVGETEKALTALFSEAGRRSGRSVLFLDELDGMCRQRSSGEEEHTRRLKTHLLQLLDGVGSRHVNLLLLAATNCPWDLDPAFLRRFQRRIYIPLPNSVARRRLIELHLAGTETRLGERDWRRLTEVTRGMSGSDLAELTQDALYRPVRQLESARHWRPLGHDGKYMACTEKDLGAFPASVADIAPHKVVPRDLELCDFTEAARNVRPSVTTAMLQQYQTFQAH